MPQRQEPSAKRTITGRSRIFKISRRHGPKDCDRSLQFIRIPESTQPQCCGQEGNVWRPQLKVQLGGPAMETNCPEAEALARMGSRCNIDQDTEDTRAPTPTCTERAIKELRRIKPRRRVQHPDLPNSLSKIKKEVLIEWIRRCGVEIDPT